MFNQLFVVPSPSSPDPSPGPSYAIDAFRPISDPASSHLITPSAFVGESTLNRSLIFEMLSILTVVSFDVGIHSDRGWGQSCVHCHCHFSISQPRARPEGQREPSPDS